MNAGELFAAIVSLPSARAVPTGNGAIVESAIMAGVELAHASVIDERALRSTWKKRQGGGARPLLLVVDDPERECALRVLGPRDSQGPVRIVSATALLDVVQRASAMPDLQAVRTLAQEVERLDQAGVAGLIVKGLGTQHLYRDRLARQGERWGRLGELAAPIKRSDWRDVLTALGYKLERRKERGYVARSNGAPACVVHPMQSPAKFSRLDDEGRPPEGLLLRDCESVGAPYGILAAGSRLRLFAARPEAGSAAGRYLDFDAGALPDENRPFLALLSPTYLAEGGFAELLGELLDE